MSPTMLAARNKKEVKKKKKNTSPNKNTVNGLKSLQKLFSHL